MATTGESLWSDLLDRHDDFSTISRHGIYAQLLVFPKGLPPFSTAQVLLKDFKLSSFEFACPKGTPISVHVRFTRFSLGRLGVTSEILLRWPHFWVVRNDFSMVRFPYKPGHIRVKYFDPRVSIVRVGHNVKNTVIVHPRDHMWSEATPARISNRSFDYVSRHTRVTTRLRSKKRMARWYDAPLRPNPHVILTNIINGSEQTGIPWSQSTVGVESYRRTFSSVRTPNFRKLKRSQYPVNPFTTTIVRTNIREVAFFQKLRSSPGTYRNRVRSPAFLFDDIPAGADFDSTLYNKFVKKLASRAETDVNNVAVDFAEVRQTVDMIANTATRISTSLLNLKHGNISGAIGSLYHNTRRKPQVGNPSVTKSLANNWLELQYGWKPLLQDIDGSMRALAQLVQTNDLLRTVRASARSGETISKFDVLFANQPVEFLMGGVPLTSVGQGEIVTSSSIRGLIRFKMQDRVKSFLAQLGFTSPINLTWELLPYSFVVDWFLPIGPYLETLVSWDGYTFKEGSITYFYRNTSFARVNFVGALPRSPLYDTRLKGTWFQDQIGVTREKLITFPFGRFPELKNPVSVHHALNAISLMTNAFK